MCVKCQSETTYGIKQVTYREVPIKASLMVMEEIRKLDGTSSTKDEFVGVEWYREDCYISGEYYFWGLVYYVWWDGEYSFIDMVEVCTSTDNWTGWVERELAINASRSQLA